MEIQISDKLRVITMDVHNWNVERLHTRKATQKTPNPEPQWLTMTYHCTAVSAVCSAIDQHAKQHEDSMTVAQFMEWYEGIVAELKERLEAACHTSNDQPKSGA